MSVEISQALRQTFEAAVLTELFPQSKIDIFVQVLQSDGSKCINQYIHVLITIIGEPPCLPLVYMFMSLYNPLNALTLFCVYTLFFFSR